MSNLVPKTLPIGPCQVYWNNIRMGSPKSQANIRYTKNTVQTALEDTGLNVMSYKTGETVEIDVTIADIKLTQMRYIFNQAVEFASSPAISTAAYDASTSTVVRFSEAHTFVGTDNITLDAAKFATGTINVFKGDWSNTPTGFVRGTDFTADSAAGTVARIDGGSMTDGDNFNVEYNATSTVELLGMGGQLADFEGELRIVHELNNGTHLQLLAHRAKTIGATDTQIQMAAEFAGQAMTFHVLGDLNKTVGKQLVEWAIV